MNDNKNPFEDMEAQYERNIRLGKEFEKIDLAAGKVKEKYGDYEELKEFVDYLEAMERLFIRAELENWGDTRIKEELVVSEIRIFSKEFHLDEDVLKKIKDDFGQYCFTVRQIHEIAERLLEKYASCEDCKNFIEYLKETNLFFIEAEKNHWNRNVIKEKLCKLRMKNLTSDGSPDLKILEEIKVEFEKQLS